MDEELDIELDIEDDLDIEIEQRILHNADGEPLEDEIEIWVNRYFQSVIEILNGFFAHVTPAEAVERLQAVSFNNLVEEQLEGEPEAVITLATTLIDELKAVEIEFMRAYCE